MDRGRTVLVVDDEAALRDTLAYNLRREGYHVLLAADGEQGLHMAIDSKPDLVLLDLMLPGMDGLAVCTALRRRSAVPVVMLTARDDEIDRVVGLEVGADDYVTKPYSMRELMARVKAHLRRATQPSPPKPEDASVLQRGSLSIDRDRRSVRRDGQAIALRPKEFDLLVELAARPGVVHTRDMLLSRVWGFASTDILTRTVDVHVTSLRKKVEPDPEHPTIIETVRGVGYRLAE